MLDIFSVFLQKRKYLAETANTVAGAGGWDDDIDTNDCPAGSRKTDIMTAEPTSTHRLDSPQHNIKLNQC